MTIGRMIVLNPCRGHFYLIIVCSILHKLITTGFTRVLWQTMHTPILADAIITTFNPEHIRD
jgi:hypothetical protein